MEGDTTPEDIERWCLQAKDFLGFDVVYDAAQFASMDLREFDKKGADEELAAGIWQQASTRQGLCKRLLMLSVVKLEEMHGPNALELLTKLR